VGSCASVGSPTTQRIAMWPPLRGTLQRGRSSLRCRGVPGVCGFTVIWPGASSGLPACVGISSSAAAASRLAAKAERARLHGRSSPRAVRVRPPEVHKVSAHNEVIRGLQGDWVDDLGLQIQVSGDLASFSDSPDKHEFAEEDGALVLRGAKLVGTALAPVWVFPWGIERRWARAELSLPGDEQWAQLFYRYKGKRLQVWSLLCDAALAGDTTQTATLSAEWNEATQMDGLPEEQQTRLARGQHLVPGVCFAHLRFGYRGIILGHEPKCTATASWRAKMGVPQLPRGESQPFYHCIVDERDRPGGQVTFVAEENIEASVGSFPVKSELAGVFFKPCPEVRGYRPLPRLEEALSKQSTGGSFAF